MKMGILPRGMWLLFRGGFEKQLPLLDVQVPDGLMKQANRKYREIIGTIQPFGENDALEMNIISAAMLAAVYLSLPEKPEVKTVERYYAAAMDPIMRLFLKCSDYYTAKYQSNLAAKAQRSRRSANPYSWRFSSRPAPRLTALPRYLTTAASATCFSSWASRRRSPPCAYDYAMAEKTGTVFTRQYTIAGGGPHCDCHYRKG